ncbi:hypothetical protein L202_02900 [Cryptococcus amylolentus CBS 6039]|uniref:WW domain-containing protein n=2 Tax=Cryptococcus amylolentus TaxID=104669 RepID=A0A1E3HWN3_9TREE|nr:hypothetical protein L202_02900 [Cryptococcus amylolentus CBS 6039]ODN80743.1 hypothetical protein L202_02900 [Cryptococcus amylolentus CBS 6039]ODO09273.1 hypothetical protein I350_02873 [Cryptococcus amylolentus CBS 6273]
MASPAPQGDQGDLPAPWIRQFDPNYQTFFYVNPTTNPPTTSWTHPSLSEGQVHPEQAQALQESSHIGGSQGESGGEAAKFLNSGSVADPSSGSYQQQGQGQIQGADGQSPQTGDRGIGSMVSGLMGKQNNQYGYNQQQQYGQYGQQQYGQQQYGGYNQGYPQQQQQQSSGGKNKFGFGSGMAAGGAALIAGKLISNVVGGHHNSFGGHNMGAPPFMGGGGGGGMGGMGGLGSLLGGGGGGMGGMFGGGGMGGPGMGGGGHHGGGHHGGGGFGGPGGFGGGGGGW